jgi:hypothetical protein
MMYASRYTPKITNRGHSHTRQYSSMRFALIADDIGRRVFRIMLCKPQNNSAVMIDRLLCVGSSRFAVF